ncbi:hypothetical protein GCM10025868_33050 [Angustibacter aerolatus]|uniref:Uncharacterized protein n=1 Tax=Angustibacter aerolatus TaxID=1162965 RepID=A0ABQ6JLC8_9ACTN|nr:hypothetical protein GCM10025868_33050 [Angustibacter aerolatus]
MFGLVRALPLLALRRATSAADLHRVFDRLERWRRPADLVARSALVAGAVAVPAALLVGGTV